MLHGDTTPGTVPFILRGASVIVAETPVALYEPRFLSRAAVRLSPTAPVDGTERIRAVLYTDAGVLIAAGPVRTLADADADGLVWLDFDGAAGRVLTQGTYRAGIQVGDGDRASILTDAVPPNPRPAVHVAGPPPADGPFLAWNLASATVPELTIEMDGPGSAPSAAVFAQPGAPAHDGPSMWIHAQREDDLLPGDPVTITFDTAGTGSPAQDTDVMASIGAATGKALHRVDFAEEGDIVVLDVVWAPAEQPIEQPPPERLDALNHLRTDPFLLETTPLIRIPENVSDDYLAALPWDVTQRAFSRTGPVRGSRRRTRASWYGFKTAPNDGAQAIARTGSDLAELVGDRIRLRRTHRGRTAEVFLYVADEQSFPDDVDEDLWITWRAFIALGNPALDNITVTLDVLA